MKTALHEYTIIAWLNKSMHAAISAAPFKNIASTATSSNAIKRKENPAATSRDIQE
jgi:hypothetical protein